MGMNWMQKIGGLGNILVGVGNKLDARERSEDRRQANLGPTLDPGEWGDIRPGLDTINQALETSQGRIPTIRGQKPEGQRFDRDAERAPDTYRNPVTQAFYVAAEEYQEALARGETPSFDQETYRAMVQWAKVNDEALYWNLVGGKGQEVLMGYDPETGEARGQDPNAFTPENVARHLEEGTQPYLDPHASGYDIAAYATQYDFPRAEARWQEEVAAAGQFKDSNEALLGRGGELHSDITSAYDSSIASVRDITALTQGGIDTAREENRLGRERFQTNFKEGLDRSEARRTRGLSEFVDDTAQRIEVERLGLNRRFTQERESMMRDMQASGASQREIRAAVRTQTQYQREELSGLSMQHNIAVATERSALGLSYDTLTASYDELGLSGMNALERAGVVAESGFATLTAQAADAVARNTIMVEHNAVTLRGQADMAFLGNNVVYSNMLARLSESMPQMSEWAAVAFAAENAEDAISLGYFQLGQAGLTQAFEGLSAAGDRERDAEIREDSIAASKSNATFGSLMTIPGTVVSAFGAFGGGGDDQDRGGGGGGAPDLGPDPGS